jgi:hypothetical protein
MVKLINNNNSSRVLIMFRVAIIWVKFNRIMRNNNRVEIFKIRIRIVE